MLSYEDLDVIDVRAENSEIRTEVWIDDWPAIVSLDVATRTRSVG